jgi:trk system potassium uptake protein
MTVARTICLGFLAVITVGTLLLMLPISLADGSWGDFITALFTSTSAVCVTGLIIVDTGTHFSFFGQAAILLMIQVGGLGYMTATTFLLLLLGVRLGLRDKIAIQQSLDQAGMSGAGQLVQSIIAVTLIFELTGTFLMIPVFAADYPLRQAIWLALFHSVSAFNNAGFGLFPDNIIGYATSLPINMQLYFWLRDRLLRRQRHSSFSLNFKIVTSTTLFLLVGGTLAFLFVEYENPGTFGSFSFTEKVMLAWFQGVVPRTAGFNSIDYGQMTDAGLFITIALMFVGGSPGGTAGGIKTTTIRILFDCTKAVLRGKEEVVAYRREIPLTLILKAIGVVFGSGMTVAIVTTLIAISDPDIEFIQVFFEATSAFATVGLSTGITAQVSTFAKLVLIATMYVGRVGILLLMSAVLGDPSPTAVNYPEENLLVG